MTPKYVRVAEILYNTQIRKINRNPEDYIPNTSWNRGLVRILTGEQNPELLAFQQARDLVGQEELTLRILALNEKLRIRGKRPIPMPKFG